MKVHFLWVIKIKQHNNVYKNYNEIQQCLQELQRNTTMFIRTTTKYNNVYKNYIEIQQCLQELQRDTTMFTKTTTKYKPSHRF